MAPRTHVWMLNMGGPDRPEAVRPFIEELLGDPMVVQLPVGWRWLQRAFAWLVARLRAPKLLPVYERLGGASPQLRMVEEQALALGRVLGERYHCRPVLRYARPGADEAAEALVDGDQLVLLSLYPHACRATTGTSLADARRAVEAARRRVAVAEVASYPADPGYVEAVAETVREAIRELPDGADYAVLFSAHGIPERLARAGDPYPGEIRATVEAVVAAVPLERPHHLSYQSRVGRARWLGPATVDRVRELGREGVKALVVVPLSFTSDHVETLDELDRELRRVAEEAGIERFVRAPVVGTRPTFVRALAELVRAAERAAGWEVPEDAVAEAARQALREEAEREARAAEEARAVPAVETEDASEQPTEIAPPAGADHASPDDEDTDDEDTEEATPVVRRPPPGAPVLRAPGLGADSRLAALAAADEDEPPTVVVSPQRARRLAAGEDDEEPPEGPGEEA